MSQLPKRQKPRAKTPRSKRPAVLSKPVPRQPRQPRRAQLVSAVARPTARQEYVDVPFSEVVATLNSATTFRNQRIIVTPTSFPWLGRIATNYERYEFTDLQFKYHPIVSEYANAGSQGEVTLSVEYDVTDQPPTTTIEAQTQQTWIAGLPSRPLLLRPDRRQYSASQPRRFTGSPPEGTDIHLYYSCSFDASVEGCPTNDVTIGRLHAQGRVRFYGRSTEAQVQDLNLENYQMVGKNTDSTWVVNNLIEFGDTFHGNPSLVSLMPSGWYKVSKDGYYRIRASICCGSATAIQMRFQTYNGTASQDEIPVAVSSQEGPEAFQLTNEIVLPLRADGLVTVNLVNKSVADLTLAGQCSYLTFEWLQALQRVV